MGIAERRERERRARRDAVLDATRELVREHGFNGTTTRRIAERSELSEATLFFYFSSKEEILVSLLFEGIEFTAAGLEEIAAAALAPQERLERVWEFLFRIRSEHPEYFQVFAYLAHPQATASVDASVRAELARRSGDNFRLLAGLLADAVGAERARVAADLVWAASAGLVMLLDSRVNLDSAPHPDPDDLRIAFDLLTGGMDPQDDG